MKNNIKWAAGIFLGLSSLGSLVQGSAGSFVCLLGASAICIPPVLNFLQKQWLWIMPSWAKYTSVAGLILCGYSISHQKNNSITPPSSLRTITVHDTIYVERPVNNQVEASENVPVKKASKDKAVKEIPVNALTNIDQEDEQPVTYSEVPKAKKRKRSSQTNTSYISSGNSIYHRGPRGGCFYYSSSGKKVYVDRSLCN